MSNISIPSQCLAIWLVSLVLVGCEDTLDRSLSFSLTSRKNQTGHTVTEVLLDRSSRKLPEGWKLSIKHSFTEHGGIQTFHLKGILTAPPTRPSDYELFPGVGYYKFHTTVANGFEDASSICTKEGGHLAIVNSESEKKFFQTIFERHPESIMKHGAFIGFHDRLKEGEYLTIFGQPLSSTGFTGWSPGQPDDHQQNEDCGSIYRNGALNDIPCNHHLPFLCEYDLSWSEI